MLLYVMSSEIHQTCVFYIKKLFIAVLSVLVKRPKNVLKASQSDIRSVMPWDIHWTSI